MIQPRSLFFLVGGLVVYYLAVVWSTGFFTDPLYILYQFAPDSLDYLAVADWLFKGAQNTLIERRTFLYPAAIGLSQLLGGGLGVWLMQMTFWILSAVLFYLNLSTLTLSPRVRAVVFVAFCLVWTPILLSLIVLAEALAFPIFSLAAFFLIFLRDRFTPATRYLGMLVCCGFLSVVKPNFTPLFYVMLISLAALWATRRLRLGWLALVTAVTLAFSPMFVQMILHRKATGVAATSNIGYNVMEMTYYPQVLAKVMNLPFIQVRAEVERSHPPMREMVLFELRHPWISFTCFLRNLEENTREVFHIRPEPYPFEAFWRRKLNDIFYFVHILFLIPTALLLWRGRRLRDDSDITLFLLTLLFWIPLLTTGISFWAADRYSVPVLPVWPLLYTWVGERLRLESRARAPALKALTT